MSYSCFTEVIMGAWEDTARLAFGIVSDAASASRDKGYETKADQVVGRLSDQDNKDLKQFIDFAVGVQTKNINKNGVVEQRQPSIRRDNATIPQVNNLDFTMMQRPTDAPSQPDIGFLEKVLFNKQYQKGAGDGFDQLTGQTMPATPHDARVLDQVRQILKWQQNYEAANPSTQI